MCRRRRGGAPLAAVRSPAAQTAPAAAATAAQIENSCEKLSAKAVSDPVRRLSELTLF